MPLPLKGNTYFLSRPRRFGKSLLLSTLRAYFEGKKELFKGLKIDKLEKDWHVHRVFHFDFNSVNFTQPNALEETLDYELSQWEKEYGIEAEFKNQFGLRLEKILQVAAEQTGHGAVVLIDGTTNPCSMCWK